MDQETPSNAKLNVKVAIICLQYKTVAYQGGK